LTSLAQSMHHCQYLHLHLHNIQEIHQESQHHQILCHEECYDAIQKFQETL
jgi:hypothetical protein